MIFLIQIYQYAFSPLKSPCCRFFPTCSEYCIEAIKTHGFFKGFLFSAKRIMRCNRFVTGGLDFVPPKK